MILSNYRLKLAAPAVTPLAIRSRGASVALSAPQLSLSAGHSKETLNMDEKTFEDIICKYPDLIEDKLPFKGRQVIVAGKRVDVLFEDRHGQKLIVEIKKGTVRREDVAQLLDYEGYFVSPDDPNVRVMLVGNRVPENLRRSLDHHGFEWKEFTTTYLINFLRDKCDPELLNRITTAQSLTHDTQRTELHLSGIEKHLPIERVAGAASAIASHAVSPSQGVIKRAVARIHEEYLEDPSFHSVRRQAETKAKEMLDGILGGMSSADIRHFLGYVNTESIKGRTGLTRFGRHFTNIVSEHICGSPHEFNEWIGALWKVEEGGLQDVLTSFLMNAPIKGAGTLLPTFVLYLRAPTSFNIWTKKLEANLAAAYLDSQLPRKSQHERYAHFNRRVFDLLVTPFRLAPEEVDLVLSQLPTYLV